MNVTTKRKSPWGAVLRSAIFPGWGQWYNGKWFKAIVIFGAETGLLANSLYLNYKFQNSKYDTEREYYRDNRNLSNWWLAGVFFFSLLDAYVDAQLSDFDESPDLSLRSGFARDRNSPCSDGGAYVGLWLSFRF